MTFVPKGELVVMEATSQFGFLQVSGNVFVGHFMHP